MYANALAAQGEWRKSAQVARQFLRENESWKRRYLTAFLLLAADDMDGYRETCQELADKYSRVESARNSITLTCSLGEGGAQDMAALLKAAAWRRKLQNNDPSTLTALGFLQFRAGQFKEASETLNRALSLHAVASIARPDATGELRLARLTCHTFLAMAYEKLGKTEAMTKSVATANKLVAEMESSEPTPGLVAPWIDRFGVEIARRELGRLETPVAESAIP
jgi:hypothetical protein